MNSEKAIERLRIKYREDLLLEEFTSPDNSNRADAIGISLHPSRSTDIVYYEIKASESDWLKELDKPSKSEGLAQYCDRIWLVTETQDVARLDEIPENWGWMFLRNKRFKVLKEAPKVSPIIDKNFLIRIAQYSSREFNHKLWKAGNEAYIKAKKDIEAQMDSDYWKQQFERKEKRVDKLEKMQNEFEKATNNYFYEPEKVKEFVTLTNALIELKKTTSSLDDWWNIRTSLRRLKELIVVVENAIKEMKKIEVYPNEAK